MTANPMFITKQYAISKRIEVPGRYAVTVECADDLTNDEIIRMEAAIEAHVCLLQKNARGYRIEHVAAFHSHA
jgi:hypothetical protein